MRGLIDKTRNWIQLSYEKRTNGGAIFMGVSAVIFVGVLVWIFNQ